MSKGDKFKTTEKAFYQCKYGKICEGVLTVTRYGSSIFNWQFASNRGPDITTFINMGNTGEPLKSFDMALSSAKKHHVTSKSIKALM